MKARTLCIYICLVLIMLVSIVTVGCRPASQSDNPAVRAYADPIVETMLKALNANDYAGFSADFDEQMKQAITSSAFDELTATIKGKIGDYVSKEFVSTGVQQSFTVVLYSAKFTSEPADVMVTVSFHTVEGKNLVSGFFLNSPKLRQT